MARAYCNFSSAAAKAAAGKDIIVGVFTTDDVLLALGGQRDFTLNRSAETVDTASKDTQGGWSSSVAGMKEWSLDSGGIYVIGDQSHALLTQAFNNGDPVCVKVVDIKNQTGLWGGLAVVTDYLFYHINWCWSFSGFARKSGGARCNARGNGSA